MTTISDAGETFARQILEHSPVANLLVGAEGDIVYVNRELEALFGYGRKELLGNSMEMLVPERYRRHHVGLRENYAANPVHRRMAVGQSLTGLHRSGREIPVEIAIGPIQHHDERYVLAAIVDISERLVHERKIREQSLNLEAALHEKESLLREIHHRVKNNLQVVGSILRMQARGTSSPDAKQGLQDCVNRVQVMARVHEQLYRSEQMDAINMGQQLRSLTEQHLNSNSLPGQRIQLDAELEGIVFDLNEAIPLGLIVNELLSNATKHAFKERLEGRLYVEFKRIEENSVRLVVEDDGPGLPLGDGKEPAANMGMTLIRDLTDQIGARLEIQSDRGSRFVITIPLPERQPEDDAVAKESVA